MSVKVITFDHIDYIIFVSEVELTSGVDKQLSETGNRESKCSDNTHETQDAHENDTADDKERNSELEQKGSSEADACNEKLNAKNVEGSISEQSLMGDKKLKKDEQIQKPINKSIEKQEAEGNEEGLCASASAKSEFPDSTESIYHIKWVWFKGRQVPVITQNENGPCPLLAIMNVLLLQKRVHLVPQTEVISANQLMAHLGDCVLQNVPGDEVSFNYTLQF